MVARDAGPAGAAAHAGSARTYQVRTYGCQMNVHDSERLAGLLEAAGYQRADAGVDADVVVFNTCAVRENADNKLYGNLSHLAPRKRDNPEMQIAVGGCLAQKDRDALLRKAPWVDVIFGTHNIGSLPTLLERARHNKVAQVEIAEALQEFPSSLPSARESAYAAWVSISVGCNNSCTFCIVPSVRGKEVDRSPDDILAEVASLVDDGVLEVTLLGQNVNAYGVSFADPALPRDRGAFARLLRACGDIDGLERVRFTSPHPAEFTDDVIEAPSPTRPCPATAAPSPACCGRVATSTGWNECGSPRRIRPNSPTTSSRRWRRRPMSAPPCTCRCSPDPTGCCARCDAPTAPSATSASSIASAPPCRTPPSPLRACGDIDGLERVRFTSPHPAEFTDDVIEAMAQTPNVCPALHMPLQSGSDRVLRAMRRSYRAERYLGIIDRVRAAMPHAAITTDLIVGFPGETEEDFAATLDVVRRARFSAAFTFQYSKRPGTPAADLAGQIPKAVVQERYDRLIALQEAISLEGNRALIGQTVELLVATGEGRKDSRTARMTGRARDGRLVHFAVDAPADTPVRPGDIITTVVTEAAPHHLIADAGIGTHRRTRAGDAQAAGQRPRGIGLGMPAVGPPVGPAEPLGCAL